MPDREKVIKEYEDYVNSYISLTTSDDYEFEMHKAVLALLKEQENELTNEEALRFIEKLKSDNNELREKYSALLKEQEAIIEQYHKADVFLETHGWKWEGR